MSLVKDGIGLFLILLSWFNPFSFALPIRIAIFILGFDTMSILPKVLIFILYFFFPLLGEALSFLFWTLIILAIVEVIVSLLEKEGIVRMIVKPLIVFVSVFIGLNDLQLALIAAGIDLILNLKF